MYPWYLSLNLQMVILFPDKCVHIAVQSPDENSFAVLTACTPTVTNHINHISILHFYILLFIDKWWNFNVIFDMGENFDKIGNHGIVEFWVLRRDKYFYFRVKSYFGSNTSNIVMQAARYAKYIMCKENKVM